MIVGAHQTERAAPHADARGRHTKANEKPLVIVGVGENLLAVVAARHDVIQRVGDMHTQRARHRSAEGKRRSSGPDIMATSNMLNICANRADAGVLQPRIDRRNLRTGPGSVGTICICLKNAKIEI